MVAQSVNKRTILGDWDKVLAPIFAGVLVALLLWIGSQTHQNAVLLATVSTEITSFKELVVTEDGFFDKRMNRLESKQDDIMKRLQDIGGEKLK